MPDRVLLNNQENTNRSWPRSQSAETSVSVGCNFGHSQLRSGYFNALLNSSTNHRLKNGGWSGGGPLYVQKTKIEHRGITSLQFRPFDLDIFGEFTIGGVVGIDWSLPDQLDQIPSYATASAGMSSHGVTAYKKSRPGRPGASLGQFLVELRDLPTLPLTGKWKFRNLSFKTFQDIPVAALKRVKSFKSLGSEYLNVVFGWVPFVSDLRKIYLLWQNVDKKMAQLSRENGKVIHRRGKLNEVNDVTQTEVNYNYPYANIPSGPPNFGFNGFSRYTVTTRTNINEWYSNAYQYYIPDVGTSQWTRRAKLALFGAIPNPELIWEVTPWSWLIDWFSNVGDVVSNLTQNAAENLTVPYSYTMRHVLVTSQAQCDSYHTASPAGWWPERDCTFTSTRTSESKLRGVSGSPFQFGLSDGSLTASQAGILAALGASRGLVR